MLFLISLFLFCSCEAPQTLTEATKPPNILLIISDDQAWSDYSFLGHPHIETPRLDQLARQSLTFTRGYVVAPLCSPSLATMISGLYPHQHGITGNDPLFEFEGRRYSKDWRIARNPHFAKLMEGFYKNELLTQRLQKKNYRSLQTGKWWMGSWKDGYFTDGMTHGDYTKDGRHGDAGLTIGREGLQPIYDFIETSDSLDQAFFVWYAPFLPHTPHTPPKDLEEKYLPNAPTPAVARYWAMCEWFDQTCGQLIDFLEEKKLSEETLVVYVCDNGWIQEPEKPNRYAARSKQSPYEGGIRTPVMFRWPGKIKPKLDTTTLVSSIDLVPTIMAAAGLEKDEKLPGLNALSPAELNQREVLFAEDFQHDIQDVEQPTRSLEHRMAIDYPWKLILPEPRNVPDQPVELFNISVDPNETQNLAGTHPEKVEELKKRIDAWWKPEGDE